jgi:hypothetical protein
MLRGAQKCVYRDDTAINASLLHRQRHRDSRLALPDADIYDRFRTRRAYQSLQGRVIAIPAFSGRGCTTWIESLPNIVAV